ncbi:hypothetical protein [Chitinophaga solisilvae]|uniref:hypothetical protein n=1 Tax=Chitinophaga solisilvae TaxID=1233460 RepID=UPI0019224E54|nr:hypothetical protein [Chitinophaga solisilvae]
MTIRYFPVLFQPVPENIVTALDGTYELEPLSGGICRLHLYSHFKLATSFNFYASWWASWIMKDIQQNILQVIRHRAEGQ